MQTTVINLFGGAGIGKSTFAARLFTEMKTHGHNVELAREWVKLWAYEKRKLTYADQAVVFGHQIHEETSFYGKIDCLITDSPLILSGFYEKINYGSNLMLPVAKAVMKEAEGYGVKYWNLVLKRQWSYQAEGRWQTEEQAKIQDKLMVEFLKKNKLEYEVVNNVEDVMLELLQ
ncbi:MAG: AAA family ATPase [bacterium]